MALKKVSDVACMVVDNSGMFVELARRLARDYKKVFYHCPNEDSAPLPQPSYIGYGFDEIEVVQDYFGDHYDESDMLLFAGVGMGSYQIQAESEGKAVWGSRGAETLELDRELTKKYFKSVGIPVGPYKVIVGIDALREYLKYNKDVHVKVSKWRGLIETFGSKSRWATDLTLDIMAARLGPLKNLIRFIVEEDLDNKVEIGNDMYTVDGEFPSLLSGGVEIKDKGYITKIQKYEDFPKCLRDVNEKLAPALKKYGARCTIATEMRVGKDKVAYPVDLTLREPSPPGELLQEMYTNISEIRWKGANGEMVDPKPIAKFGVQININSDQLNHKEPQQISFPEKFRNNIKLHAACKIEGQYYIMPIDYEGDEGAGAVVGWGSSIKEAVEMAKEVADSVEGLSLSIPVESIAEDAEEELEKAAKMGLEMM